MKGAGSSRRQQARRATESVACRRAELVPLSPINCCPRLSRCSVCETHDPTGEPSAGNPPAGFGERRLETGPRRGVRHRHCESRREQLPPPPNVTAPVADSTTSVSHRSGVTLLMTNTTRGLNMLSMMVSSGREHWITFPVPMRRGRSLGNAGCPAKGREHVFV